MLDDEGNPIPNAPPKPPQNPLKFDMLKQNLKKLSKTFDGFSYAFTELDMKKN